MDTDEIARTANELSTLRLRNEELRAALEASESVQRERELELQMRQLLREMAQAPGLALMPSLHGRPLLVVHDEDGTGWQDHPWGQLELFIDTLQAEWSVGGADLVVRLVRTPDGWQLDPDEDWVEPVQREMNDNPPAPRAHLRDALGDTLGALIAQIERQG